MSGDELNVKSDQSYHKHECKRGDELKESSFSSKPFALPRPSVVTEHVANVRLLRMELEY